MFRMGITTVFGRLYGPQAPGRKFCGWEGRIIGKHKGITNYTVGQRKGLNLSMGRPVYVVEIRPEANEVVVGDNGDVFSDKLTGKHVNFMSIEGIREN